MFLLVLSCFFRRRKQIVRAPHRLQVYLLPLEGVRGVEPSLGEGWGRSWRVGVGHRFGYPNLAFR